MYPVNYFEEIVSADKTTRVTHTIAREVFPRRLTHSGIWDNNPAARSLSSFFFSGLLFFTEKFSELNLVDVRAEETSVFHAF